MNIAIIGKYNVEGFGLHIEETLHKMGHQTIRVDPEVSFSKSVDQRLNKLLNQFVVPKLSFLKEAKVKKLASIYQNNQIDLTLVLHDFLTKKEIDVIKKINKNPIVLWFPDAISNFQKSMFFFAGYDYLLFCDKYIVNKLREEFNLNTFYLPQCFNPDRHKNVDVKEKKDIERYTCEITNAGNLYPSRAALYRNLSDYNFKMWGVRPSSWLEVPELEKMIMDKVVFNEEKSKAFKAAKIVLNNLHPAVIDGVNKRVFEICGIGGFQIVSYRDAVTELFEIDKEIVAYKSLNDLKEKIDYYLDVKNDDLRRSIAQAGYERALNEHTYEHRLNYIINKCKN